MSLTSHFRDNNAVSCVGRGEGGGEMKVCASQRYNSPAYFPISFHFTLSQNIIQVFLFLILFADRSLFWFQFRFLFNSF